MKKTIKNRECRETLPVSSRGGGKRVTAKESGHQIFTELARKNPDFFEILGRKDYSRRREAIRSQTYLRDYVRDLEELRRIDSRLSDLNTEIQRLRILHEKVSWMSSRNTQMDYDAVMRTRERILEGSRRRVDAIRRSGIIMIESTEEFRMFKKVQEEVGMDGVRVAVLINNSID